MPQPRTLLATRQLTAVDQRRNVVFLQQDHNTLIQQINYTFSSHVRHLTGQFTQYSNACTITFIVCKISRKKKQIPSPRDPGSSRFHPRDIPAESAGFPPSPFPCRPPSQTPTRTLHYSDYSAVADGPARCAASHRSW